MAKLSIFGNFYIDSEERLQRMKDSFLSFKNINAVKWIINARGPYKKETMAFLLEGLGSRLVGFELESPEGWFHDSRLMLKSIDEKFVLFWIEDHMSLVSDLSLYDAIIQNMEISGVEFLLTSWFWARNDYELIPKNEMPNISWFDLDETTFPLLMRKSPEAYIISCVGIFDIMLFSRLITDDDEKQAIKWPKETPFDFEKSSHDVHWLPVRIGLSKQELFASIDDDSIMPGSSLISRGLYPSRQTRKVMGSSEHIKPIKHPNVSKSRSIKNGLLPFFKSKIKATFRVLLQR